VRLDFFVYVVELACLSQTPQPCAAGIERFTGILNSISEHVNFVCLVYFGLKITIQSSDGLRIVFLFSLIGKSFEYVADFFTSGV